MLQIAPETWEKLPPEVQAYILVLENALRQSLERIAQLEQKVNELEARLNRHSGNSSQPPSQNSPQAPKNQREKSVRHPGGQPGHQENHRQLEPPEKVDKVVEHQAEACPHCRSLLAESAGRQLPPMERHQVWELPEIQPIITEHRLVAGWCPHCRVWVKPELPAEVVRSAFGPRLQAWVAILTGCFRQSRRQACLFTSRVAPSLKPNPMTKGGHFSVAIYTHLDETGWKEKGKRHWLWLAVTGTVTVFLVSGSRSRKALMELIGEAFAGILHSDRWGSYNMVDRFRRQLCWALLKRDCQALSQRQTRAGPVGAWGLREIKRLFAIWHRYQDGEITWAEMRWELVPVRTRSGKLLRRGASCRDTKAEAFCRNLLKLWPALLTFAFVPGVEPTNNRAERALRGAVLWRKGCFGNQSDNGSRFTERILTTVATLKQQDRNIGEYVVAAIQAHRTGQLAPSLLPLDQLVIEAA